MCAYFRVYRLRPPAVAVDSWSLACIIHEVFNGPLASRDKLSAVGRIPAPLVPDYKKLSTTFTLRDMYQV